MTGHVPPVDYLIFLNWSFRKSGEFLEKIPLEFPHYLQFTGFLKIRIIQFKKMSISESESEISESGPKEPKGIKPLPQTQNL